MTVDGSSGSAVIYQSELDYISRCVLDYPDTETGGDIFGFWTHTGAPVVQYVIGPGPQARRTPTSFYQDLAFLKSSGRTLRERHGLQHIGQWHSHHKLRLPTPSGHDCTTVRNAITACGLPQFLLVICTIEEAGTDINGYLFSRESPNQSPIGTKWIVLENESPIRTDMGKNYYAGFSPHVPQTEHPSIMGLRRTGFGDSRSANSPKEPLKLKGASWISIPEGRSLLKKILDQFSHVFPETSMRLEEDERVSLRFTKENGGYFKKERTLYQLTFPHEFPETVPELYEFRNGWETDLQFIPFSGEYARKTLDGLSQDDDKKQLADHLVDLVSQTIRRSGYAMLTNYLLLQ